LQKGTPETIYASPSDPFVASFIGKSNWLTPNQSMVRPEHVSWSKTGHDDLCYQAVVLSVSYVGERYEIRVQMEGLGVWTAYLDRRVRVGEKVQLYVAPERICRMNGKDTTIVKPREFIAAAN
ncbi:TPA: TOBE domain-containing protein, partial [Streptococcus pyogenes]|nr:TOBE domain-containing protein [Streptococcus pyogenes]